MPNNYRHQAHFSTKSAVDIDADVSAVSRLCVK